MDVFTEESTASAAQPAGLRSVSNVKCLFSAENHFVYGYILLYFACCIIIHGNLEHCNFELAQVADKARPRQGNV